jgi:hypothetical protein
MGWSITCGDEVVASSEGAAPDYVPTAEDREALRARWKAGRGKQALSIGELWLPTGLPRLLRAEAERRGVTLDAYVVQLLTAAARDLREAKQRRLLTELEELRAELRALEGE